MTTATDGIFSPIRIGTMSLGHRLVVPPHSGGGGALLGTEEQFDRMCRYWLARVEGGMQWVGGGPVFVRNPLIHGFEPSGIGANADGFFRHPAFTGRLGRYMDRLHAAGGFGTVQMVLQGGMPIAPSQGEWAVLAGQVKAATHLPVVYAGRVVHPQVAEAILAAG
jgi:dimethylglycine catabolism A